MSGVGLRVSLCQSNMCGVIIYSGTQIYALKSYKTALQPSHPDFTAHHCQHDIPLMLVRLCEEGSLIKGVLSILSRGVVLKETQLLINA